ncbi:hypothetical protein [Microcoleus sp. F10_A2]
MFINLNVIVTCFCVVRNPGHAAAVSGEVVGTEQPWALSGDAAAVLTSYL